MKARKWMMEYGVAMVLTFLFAVILGHIPLFHETTVGNCGLQIWCNLSGMVVCW